MNNLDATLNKFKEKEGFECFGKLNHESIHEMESELGISFPEPYKVFKKNMVMLSGLVIRFMVTLKMRTIILSSARLSFVRMRYQVISREY